MTSSRRLHTGRRLIASVVALAAAGVIMALRLTGVLEGPPGLLLFVATVLCVPTAAALSRRILFTGTILLGWGTLLWWRPVGGTSLGRMTIVWTIIVAALVYWVLEHPSPRDRVRRLVPDVRIADAAPVAVLLVGPYVWKPYLFPDSSEGAFANLGRAWDLMSHFSMTHMIRLHGATINHLGAAPDGQTWASKEYPQGYHSAAASVMELLHGPHVDSIGRELVLFDRAIGVLAIASAMLGVAAISALPAVRRGGVLTVALPVYAGAVFVLGPGAVLVANGYSNFLLAVVLTVATISIAISATRLDRPVFVAALVGGVVGVATTWFLLLLVALPAVLLVLVPWRRVRFSPTRAGLVALVVIAALGVLVLAATVAQMRLVPTDTLLQSVGSTPTLSIGSVIMTAVVIVVLGVFLWAGLRRHSPTDDHRTAVAAILPMIGLVACLGYGILQVTSKGEVSYYFWKLLYGVWMLCLLVVVMVVAGLVRRSGALRRLRYGRILVAALMVVAATQAFGLTIPEQRTSGIGPRASALDLRGVPQPTATEANLMAAAAWARRNPAADTTFVALKTEDSTPLLSTMWYFALTAGWTAERQAQFSVVNRLEGGDYDEIPGVVDALLTRRGSTVLASPADREVICRTLKPETCRRVVTWE